MIDMAVPLRHPRPRIAEVQCSRLRFQPGDRVLVRTLCRQTKGERAKLRRSVERWAGCDVEVLVYSEMDMEVTIDKLGKMKR